MIRQKIFSVLLAALLSASTFGCGTEDPGVSVSGERLFIIDDDIGMFRDEVWKRGIYILPGVPFTDPDGGVELVSVLKEPGVRVLGVTTMMGVTFTDVCTDAARRVLDRLGVKDVPVLAGAQTPADLGVETAASRFIVDTVMRCPGRVEIIGTGPLTNIATAMMSEPRLAQNWKQLHFGTGEFLGALGEPSDLYWLTLFGIGDLNINVDPEACRYVLEHGGPFPLYPNEVMDDVLFTPEDYVRVTQSGTPLGYFVGYELAILNLLLGRLGGMAVHGTIPALMGVDGHYGSIWKESAVTLKDFGWQGHAFELSLDPGLPRHRIHIRLDPEGARRMHDTIVERLY